MKTSDVNLIKDLIKNNKDIVKLTDNGGNTLLHLAIKNNCKPEIVEALLSNGVDSYLENNDGLTALELAAKDGGNSLKITELLVKKMAEIAIDNDDKHKKLKSMIDTPSDYGSTTLLERALIKKQNDELVMLLVIAGARKGIDIKDDNGQAIIERSIISNNPLAQFWFSSREDFICKLIDCALKTREISILQELVKHEELKEKIRQKITPDYLKKAKSEDRSCQFVELLVKNGIVDDNSVHSVENFDQLNRLSKEPRYEYMISALSKKDSQGKTPIDEADLCTLSLYKSYFVDYKGNEERKSFLIGLSVTVCVAALVAAFALLAIEVLYAVPVVAVIGIACTAYKVHQAGRKVSEETRDICEMIDTRVKGPRLENGCEEKRR